MKMKSQQGHMAGSKMRAKMSWDVRGGVVWSGKRLGQIVLGPNSHTILRQFWTYHNLTTFGEFAEHLRQS